MLFLCSLQGNHCWFQMYVKIFISSCNKICNKVLNKFIYPICKCLFSLIDIRVKYLNTGCDAESDIRARFTPIQKVLVW